MDAPTEIDSVYWDDSAKSWRHRTVTVDEYHGYARCQQCRRIMSHNIKSGGEFRTVYVECACAGHRQQS